MRYALGPLFDDVDFTTGTFAGMYSGLGQPGLSPALLAMVMVLQFKANLSDREAAEATRDRISEEVRPRGRAGLSGPRCLDASMPRC